MLKLPKKKTQKTEDIIILKNIKNIQKDGGYNYFKEYKKYSIDEFNKTLQETFELSKFIPKSKSQIDIFKATTPNGEINRLKKSIFSKNFNISDISKNKELNGLNNIIKLDNNNKRANRNLKIKNRDKIFEILKLKIVIKFLVKLFRVNSNLIKKIKNLF